MLKQVNITSFHYRYYMWIRYMWGCDADPTKRARSICPYVQTMFWGSIFCVLFSPALILGWICMKIGRFTCKWQTPIVDKIISYFERKTSWINDLDDGPSEFAASPLLTGINFCVMGIAITLMLAISVALVASILGGIGLGLWNITAIGKFLFFGIAFIFASLFYGFHWFGFVFYHVYAGTIWLFTNGPFWYEIGSWAVFLVAWLLVIGGAAIALCLLALGIAKLPLAKRFGAYLTNKLNGYTEAQKERKARTLEAIKKLPPWKCKWCSYNSNLPSAVICQECQTTRPKPPKLREHWPYLFIWVIPIAWVLGKIGSFGSKIKDREIDIIGPLGVLWIYLVSIKKGVCWSLEFVDPVQQQAEAQASAQERMEREASGEK